MTSLVQYRHEGKRGVALIAADGQARAVRGADNILALAARALDLGHTMMEVILADGLGDAVDLDAVTLLAPIDHPDPAHLIVTGTGLTHLGSAEGRDKMHRAAVA